MSSIFYRRGNLGAERLSTFASHTAKRCHLNTGWLDLDLVLFTSLPPNGWLGGWMDGQVKDLAFLNRVGREETPDVLGW